MLFHSHGIPLLITLLQPTALYNPTKTNNRVKLQQSGLQCKKKETKVALDVRTIKNVTLDLLLTKMPYKKRSPKHNRIRFGV